MSKTVTAVLILATLAASGAERPFDVKLVMKSGELMEGNKVISLGQIAINDKGQVAYLATFMGKTRWEDAICLDKKIVIDSLKREGFGFDAGGGIHINNNGDLLFGGGESKPIAETGKTRPNVMMLATAREGSHGIYLNDKLVLNASVPPYSKWRIQGPKISNSGFMTFVVHGEIYAIKPDNQVEKIAPPKLEGVSMQAMGDYQINDSGDFVSKYEWRKGAMPTEAIFTKSRVVTERPKSEKQHYVAWSINNAGKVAVLDEVATNGYKIKYHVIVEAMPVLDLVVKTHNTTIIPSIQINDRGTILVAADRNAVMIRGGQPIELVSDEMLHGAAAWNSALGHPVIVAGEEPSSLRLQCALNNNDAVACAVGQTYSALVAEITPRGPSAPLQELVPVSQAVAPEAQQEVIKEVAKPAEKKPELKAEEGKPEPPKVVTVMMRSQTVYKGEYVGGDTQSVFLQVEGNLLKLKIKDVDTVIFAAAETAKGKPEKAEKGKPGKAAPDKPGAAERMGVKAMDIWMKGKK